MVRRLVTSRLLQALLLGLSLALPQFVLASSPQPILLAKTYSEAVDPAAYLVSEKLDGVRAIWDGRVLRFRSGKIISAPAWFIAGLPKQPLDGELWLARGEFDRLSGIVRREMPDDAEWHQVRYMVFELPEGQGRFDERAVAIERIVREAGVPWLRQISQFSVVDRKSLQQQLDEVVRGGGEGLMLHRADAPYQTGRRDVLLKMKPLLDDEATVIGHLPGKGRFAGQLGALRVRTPDGRVFSLGSGLTDALRKNPPPVGAVVTYRYREIGSGGLPRFASFWRVREE